MILIESFFLLCIQIIKAIKKSSLKMKHSLLNRM